MKKRTGMEIRASKIQGEMVIAHSHSGSVEINTRDGETQRNNPTPPTLRECYPPRTRYKRFWPITIRLISVKSKTTKYTAIVNTRLKC